MRRTSGGDHELTERTAPQLRRQLVGRHTACPEEVRLRLREIDDRRRPASRRRYRPEVLEQNRRDTPTEDCDDLVGVRDRRSSGHVRRRPHQGPPPATAKLGHELAQQRTRRLLGPHVQDGSPLDHMSRRGRDRCRENHSKCMQRALECLHLRERVALPQRSCLQVDVLAEEFRWADERHSLGLWPQLRSRHLLGCCRIIGVTEEDVDPVEAADDDLAGDEMLDRADTISVLAQAQDVARRGTPPRASVLCSMGTGRAGEEVDHAAG